MPNPPRTKPASRARSSLATLLLLALAGCRRDTNAKITAEEALLDRQRQGLEALIAAAEKGPLIPFSDVLVVVDQGLVQDLLTAATPYERVIQGGFRIRITNASVRFDDGFGLVRLDGRASLARQPEAAAFAEVSVFGGLDIVDLDPASGILRGRLKIIAFEARKVDVLGVGAPAERLVEALGREKLDAFSVLASSIEIPVRLERDITIPAVAGAGGIRIPTARVPLHVAVKDVKAYRGRLWISVGARTSGVGDVLRGPAAPETAIP